jgi:transcriptional regulator with XRE-family HTH domain
MSTEDEILEKFGERVREFRISEGYSQEELANRAGMHRTYVSGIERGERNVALKNLTRLAQALDVTPSELVEGLNDVRS